MEDDVLAHLVLLLETKETRDTDSFEAREALQRAAERKCDVGHIGQHVVEAACVGQGVSAVETVRDELGPARATN
jgi:hypothetical protein